ncbi:MAG: amino acid ABC transporter permease [Desulfobulbus sp.]|nr:amino acid ABC transporter permease [Desulfobulbus sp.]
MSRRRIIQPLDLFLLVLLLAVAGFALYRITQRLNYTWNWGVLPQFLFRYDAEQGRWVSNYLIQGLLTTIRLSLWAGLLALPFGLVLALARIGKSLYGRLLSRTAIELLRNLPPLVIIFLFYFFLADQLIPVLQLDEMAQAASVSTQHVLSFLLAPPSQLSAFLSALLTLAVFESAYMAEIFRSGVESIERSQWEAALALGLSRRQCLWHVILPQAFRRILPPLAGQMISLVKDSAIVSVISIQELTYQGTQLMASTYLTIEVWLTVAGLYFLLTFPCSWGVALLERRLNRQQLGF